MTRDYTTVPGYEGMTQPQARYNYLHDLLDSYMRLTSEDRNAMRPCKVMEERGGCRYCSFSGFLGGDPEVCCAWRAEAQPDKAIEILEMLTGKPQSLEMPAGKPEQLWGYRFPEPKTAKERAAKDPHNMIAYIASHYTAEPQLGVAQEECAELIQAISKVRRKGANTETLSHMAEEIADVQIMCEQLIFLYNLDSEVTAHYFGKLKRQLKRIMEGDTAYETTGE